VAAAKVGEVIFLQARIIMLVDLDYFFAQCEELRNPSLKSKPVVVGVYSGRTEDSGAVSTANYLARGYGVKSGMPLFLAKRKLEGVDAVFLPVDYEYYEQVSDKLMAVFRGYADVFEQVGIEEAYLDVTGKAHGSFDEAKGLAERLKADVRQQVGVTFSVGVGPNKLVAKIAADEHKPDGLTVIHVEEVKGFLHALPVDRLLGVGRKTSKTMDALSIKTIGDLAGFSVQRLVEVFGKTLGVYFHNAANGVDDEPVDEAGEAESISRIATLKENSRDPGFILSKAYELIGDIHAELAQKRLSFRQVGILAILSDLTVRNRSKTLEQPTTDPETLRTIVRELLEKFLADSDLEVRRVGVKVSGFMKEERSQKQLTSYLVD
jgi:DNA polymerase IV (archaeal DinB-like DNA polymerase)